MDEGQCQQYGDHRHMDGSPFLKSFDGQSIPVLLTIKVNISHFKTKLLDFHLYLIPYFFQQILSDMSAACDYQHEGCRCPGKNGIEMDS